ncbi:microtubule-associated Asp [Chlorella sorokiniana]|uniref:Microtubule-associated Asp n=1 Tax=Chlorella sorokiniana TaxID=3076 RepID=A0A2P6U0H1_CHLSO|nr:microtubule-associated Asp [Chlorella sorokiniana]|eukprot:PRW59806.1 microtubule-associated Asp [Chlorella sorokiniana]
MAEPEGLGLSLDDIIARQQQKQQGGGYGKQRRGRQDGQQQQQQEWRGRNQRGGSGARGGGGGGGVRQGDQWGRPQQQQQQQQQHYNLRQQPQQQRQVEDPTAYRRQQSCWQEDDGSVIFRFRQTKLVTIDPAGNITLDAGGHYNGVTLASLNDALNLIGIRVTCPGGDVRNDDWSVSDGRTLTRFEDGVVLPAKGPMAAGRGRQLLQAFNNPHHAQQAAAVAASNAAATAAGILPFTGFVPPGIPASRPLPVGGRGGGRGGGARGGGGGNGGSGPSVFSRLGGKVGQQQDRFAPY